MASGTTVNLRDRGSMLIVALGVLVLLAVFGVAFASMMDLERSAIANYQAEVRATWVSRAGIERAIAELRQMATTKAHEDMTDSWYFGNRTATPGGEDRTGRLDRSTGALAATYPSFRMSAGNGWANGPVAFSQPRQGSEDDTADHSDDRYISGAIMLVDSTGTELPNLREVYSLKILDCASMLNIPNLRDRARTELSQANPDVNAIADTDACRMLKTLFEELGVSNGAGLAANLLEREAPIPDKDALRSALAAFYGDDSLASQAFRQIRDYVTCAGWIDGSTIRIQWRGAGAVWYQYAIVQEARAPVNINTAPRPVLVACLRGLQGVDIAGTTISLSNEQADQLADRIIAARQNQPFRSGHDLVSFLKDIRNRDADPAFEDPRDLNDNGTLGESVDVSWQQLDLVLANANPNADLNKFSLDPKIYKLVDKSDLRRLTTEFCFSSMGYFEITSLGTIYGPSRGENSTYDPLTEDMIIAEKEMQAIVQVYHVYRDTTQADFEDDRTLTSAEQEAYGTWHVASPGVLSLPGFSQDMTVRSTGVDLPWGGTETREYFELPVPPATYDGQLILNGLVNYWSFAEDFMLGFNKDRTDSSDGSGYFVAHDTHDDPTVRIPPSARTDDRPHSTPEPSGSSDLMSRARSASSRLLDLANTPSSVTTDEPLFEGSDLTSLGVMMQRSRGRYLEYYAMGDSNPPDWQISPINYSTYWENPFMIDNIPHQPADEALANERYRDYYQENWGRDYGSVEFWVQLLYTPSRGGFGGGSPHYLFEMYGGDNQRMAMYIQGGNLKLESSCANGSVTIDLVAENDSINGRLARGEEADPNQLWEPGRWHHVVVNYGIHRPGSGSSTPAADMRIFVDGQFKGLVGFRNVPVTGLIIVGPRTGVNRQSFFMAFNFYSNGGRLWIGTDHTGGSASSADAIVDNFTVTHIYQNRYQRSSDRFSTAAYVPPQRFHDGSFTGYGQLYSKRLRNMEGMGLVLGTLSFTGYMDPAEIRIVDQELASGRTVTDSFLSTQAANLIIRLMARREGESDRQVGYGSFYHSEHQWVDAEGGGSYSGPATPGTARVGERVHSVPLSGLRIFEGERLEYQISLTPSPRGTVLQSPVLDDVTITYLPTPAFLYITEDVVEE